MAVEEAEGFEAGARLVTRAMLQSPRFIYRLESQVGSGVTTAVDDYELATRLSFLAWNAGPDDILLASVATGSLRHEIGGQIDRLLDHPLAQRALRQYIEQWLHLDAVVPGCILGSQQIEAA